MIELNKFDSKIKYYLQYIPGVTKSLKILQKIILYVYVI